MNEAEHEEFAHLASIATLLTDTQTATSRSSAGLSWMVKVDPLNSIRFFFLKSASVRVIDSRRAAFNAGLTIRRVHWLFLPPLLQATCRTQCSKPSTAM